MRHCFQELKFSINASIYKEIAAFLHQKIQKFIQNYFYLFSMNEQEKMDIESSGKPVTIGYYPFRAKAQMCRLICEYVHLPYVDLLFTPDQWTEYKKNQAKDWIIKDLPFIQDDDFVVTGPISMVTYVIEKTNRHDLFGRTVEDKIKIDSIRTKQDLRNAILGLICTTRPTIQKDDKKCMKHYWTTKIQPILNEYQSNCPMEGWYLGYISVMDFFIYEILNLIENLFPTEIYKLKKLIALRQQVASIKEIQEYQNSSRAIKQYCPVRYFSKYMQEKMKHLNEGSTLHTSMDTQ